MGRIGIIILTTLYFAIITPRSVVGAEIYLPKNMENCLVTFEKIVEDTAGTHLKPHGTGFIMEDTSTKNTFIVTNRHVLGNRDSIVVRFNAISTNEPGIYGIRDTIALIEKGTELWVAHGDSTIDLAVVKIDPDFRCYLLGSDRIKSLDSVKLGDQALFLGFPLLPAALGELNYPLVRTGIVSFRTYQDLINPVTKEVIAYKDHLLIDGVIMTGNSGSPVLSTPIRRQSRISIIGVISSHVLELEKISSPLSPLFDVKMEKDYNLGICIPAERIFELFARYDSLKIMTTPAEDVKKKQK